jgi:hypothetical protein
MALSHSPQIVRDGLVLYLDAANIKSYPGSGTIVFDLSNKSNNATLINGVGYDNANLGSLVFDGINDYVQTPTSIGADLTGNFTFSVWAIRLGNSSSSIGGLIGNLWHTVFTGASIYFRSNNTAIEIQTADGATRTSYTLTNPVSNLNWTNYVLINNVGTVSVYVNGILIDSRLRSISPSSTRQITIGRWAGSFSDYVLNGKISNAQVYNKALTEAEVKQNFNALRGRYGI